MLELPMASLCGNEPPTVSLDQLDDLADLQVKLDS